MKKHYFLWVFIFTCFISARLNAQKTDTIRLYYDLNNFELNSINKNKIDSLLNTKKIKDSLNIFGYADYLGSNKYNFELSEKRAVFVKNYIKDKGFKQSIKYCVGKGEISKSKTETGIDRKVEIIVYSQADIPNNTTPKPITEKPKISKDTSVSFNPDSLLAGKNVVLTGLYFKKGTDELLAESYPELDKLYITLKENPSMIIEIQGHICCELITYPGFNAAKSGMGEELSTKRAKKVYDYLAKKGINKKRMSYQGYGGTKPLIKIENNKEDANKNRRVEIKVIK